jgi:hypothetical protein
MLVAAAPTTRKQVMAMMVIILVKPFPVCFRDPVHFPDNWALIKAEPCRLRGGGEFDGGGLAGELRKSGRNG